MSEVISSAVPLEIRWRRLCALFRDGPPLWFSFAAVLGVDDRGRSNVAARSRRAADFLLLHVAMLGFSSKSAGRKASVAVWKLTSAGRWEVLLIRKLSSCRPISLTADSSLRQDPRLV